eukprot:CAMPEP_0116948992 /NCGR_PEP_ID=MMETSP0467-20121206/38639_1 /TAXON_ID=283647 /ORGANISM="Mesodinium pulex, Strain SPMC105" /LENGTH=195 /DNA_ID=CAMNT_0004633523 /DNA_START=38 /DNA_END=625 /DNA_ORIENTATION=-
MNIFMIVSAVLSGLATLFYLIGCIGNSKDEDTIADVPWVTAEFSMSTLGKKRTTEMYFGLSAYATDDDSQKYSGCNGDICDDCEDAGESTLAMVAIGLLLALVACVVSVLLALGKFDTKIVKFVGIGVSLASLLFGIIAFIVFDDCYAAIDDNLDNAEYGSGMGLVLAGFIFMLIVTVLHIVAFVKGGGGGVSPA